MDLQSAAWWEALGSSEQQIMLSDFHSKGIAVMVSAFGSTGLSSPHTGIEQLMGLWHVDTPNAEKKDPIDIAQRLAAWVKVNNIDGVDVDWEGGSWPC